jgi:hypothetical protein
VDCGCNYFVGSSWADPGLALFIQIYQPNIFIAPLSACLLVATMEFDYANLFSMFNLLQFGLIEQLAGCVILLVLCKHFSSNKQHSFVLKGKSPSSKTMRRAPHTIG